MFIVGSWEQTPVKLQLNKHIFFQENAFGVKSTLKIRDDSVLCDNPAGLLASW